MDIEIEQASNFMTTIFFGERFLIAFLIDFFTFMLQNKDIQDGRAEEEVILKADSPNQEESTQLLKEV